MTHRKLELESASRKRRGEAFQNGIGVLVDSFSEFLVISCTLCFFTFHGTSFPKKQSVCLGIDSRSAH